MSAVSLMVLPVPSREDFNSKGTEKLTQLKLLKKKRGDFKKHTKIFF